MGLGLDQINLLATQIILKLSYIKLVLPSSFDLLDRASDGEVREVGEFGYSKFVQWAKEIAPIVGISCVVIPQIMIRIFFY